MAWLLKIVEGPMKGAEIALVSGLKVKVGSSDACDIVIADGTLAGEAFELDVTDAGVSLAEPSGAPRNLPPFEIAEFGTTAVAIGPAEGRWAPLTRPAKPADEAQAPVDPVDSGKVDDAGEPEGREKPRRSLGCLIWLLVLLLVVLAIWWFWPRIAEKCPQAECGRAKLVSCVEDWCATAWGRMCDKTGPKSGPVEPVKPPTETLAELAAAHGLDFSADGGRLRLGGNLARRTERLAIRALALAADPRVSFDLTDDETLKTASSEFLFAATEGALKVVSATNRVVEIAGYAPSAQKLEAVIRALNQDVPGLERLLTGRVQVGGQVPQDVVKSAFVHGSAQPVNAPAPATKAAERRDFPIAGILTQPYPCVVMRNGLRLTEGALIGSAVLEKISADRLVLKDGKTTFEWKP